ncbi:hypothetical protein D3C84_1138440 [compost metagenome]
MNQCSVSRDIDLEPFGMGGIQQVAKLRMQQRLAFDMQVDMIAVRLDLVENGIKGIQLHEVFLPLRGRTEAASQVADTCNLDVHLFKSFQVPLPISIFV